MEGRCHRDKPGDLPEFNKSNFRDKSEIDCTLLQWQEVRSFLCVSAKTKQ